MKLASFWSLQVCEVIPRDSGSIHAYDATETRDTHYACLFGSCGTRGYDLRRSGWFNRVVPLRPNIPCMRLSSDLVRHWDTALGLHVDPLVWPSVCVFLCILGAVGLRPYSFGLICPYAVRWEPTRSMRFSLRVSSSY